MADVSTIENIISNKTENDYGRSDREDNFVIDKELTVEITLHEYRNLVRQEAEARAKEAEAKKNEEFWARNKVEKEIEAIKSDLNKLKNENLYLRKKLNINPYDELNLEDENETN